MANIEYIEHETFNETNVLNNEQYNEFVWHSVQVHQTNMYNNTYQSCGKRYMPIFYEYDREYSR